jgi:hypothetical protein
LYGFPEVPERRRTAVAQLEADGLHRGVWGGALLQPAALEALSRPAESDDPFAGAVVVISGQHRPGHVRSAGPLPEALRHQHLATSGKVDDRDVVPQSRVVHGESEVEPESESGSRIVRLEAVILGPIRYVRELLERSFVTDWRTIRDHGIPDSIHIDLSRVAPPGEIGSTVGNSRIDSRCSYGERIDHPKTNSFDRQRVEIGVRERTLPDR